MKQFIIAATAILITAYSFAQPTVPFSLVDSNPGKNAQNIPINQVIMLEFSESLDPSTVANGLSVTSNLRGHVSGITTSQERVLTFKPLNNLFHGEKITLTVLNTLKSITTRVLSTHTALQFTVAAKTSLSQPAVFLDRQLTWDENGVASTTAAADMDQDSDIDLLYVGKIGVGWLENTGTDGFKSHKIGDPPTSINEIKAADIDRDGDMDVLIATGYRGVDLFINDGLQNFTFLSLKAIEIQAGSLDVADFNSDGLLDIVYSNATPWIDKTYILYNQGENVFTNIEISNVGGEKNRVADLDNDGDWDIVQCEYDGLRYLVNNGSASFESHQITGVVVWDMAITDFNNDGNIDIAVAGDAQTIYFNNGEFLFTPKVIEVDRFRGVMGTGDLDGDSDVDFIVGDYQNFNMLVNDGLNNFTSMEVQNSKEYRIDPIPFNIGTVDLDNDGDLDFFSVTGVHQVKWFENVSLAQAYPFSALNNNLKPFDDGDADWGDFDNDGDLDLIIIGISDNKATTALYENRDGLFIEKSTSLPGVYAGSSDWGDYDNDGDLDLLLMGGTVNTNGIDYRNPITLIYTNNNGIFVQLPSSAAQLPKANLGRAQWADFNNDGWLDIVINAHGASGIYQSDGKGNFSNKYSLPSLFGYGNVACADYDHDGDLDLAVSGASLLKVLRNDGDWAFAEAHGDFIGCVGGNLNWTDIDNDGDLDLIAAGGKSSGGASIDVYENKGTVFKALTNTNPLFYIDPYGTASTGDFDNDGKSDLISSGLGEIYLLKNEGPGNLKIQDIELPVITSRIATWGDYDRDHDLDIFVESGLLRNNHEIKNTLPASPSNLQVDSVYNNTAFLHWTEGNDLENGSSGLSYQIYVGTQSKHQGIVNSNSNLSTGLRKVAESGTTKGKNTRVENLTGGTYFFGVQSIDAAFEGSAFSNEASAFVIRIDGSLNVCKGSDFNYVAKPAGSYTWQVTGGTIVSGQGTDALVVNWNTTGRGYIRVSNSQNAKSTLGVSINEKPKPVIEGDATVCTGIEHYFIADQDTHFTEWAVEGVNSILEDTTHQVKIDWTSPGDYKLIAKAYSDHRGCVTENTLLVNVDSRPITSFTGPTLTCTDKIDLYTTTAINPVAWEITKGTIMVDSAKLIRVKWQSEPGLGSVVLKENSMRGYCISSDSTAVGIYSYPEKPTLLVMGDTILSSPSPSHFYKWYYNEELIFSGPYNGVISQVAGYFIVEVFNEGCGTKSDPVAFMITGIEEPDVIPNGGLLRVYPNPADQKIILEFNDEQLGELEISMYSMTNSLIKQFKFQKTAPVISIEVDISELNSGLYILVLNTIDNSYNTKFIKR